MYLRRVRQMVFNFVLLFPVLLQAQDTLYMPLLGRDIRVLILGEPASDVLMYNMHDNENTSAVAGQFIARRLGGQYYELMHDGRRNISFTVGPDSVFIDPNRIYTDAGIWQQLERNNILDTLIHSTIAAWRDSILQLLAIHDRKLVIALHNNTDKNYSIRSYRVGQEYSQEAFAIYRGRVEDQDDFYFVTEMSIMSRLSEGPYHVVLQSNDRMTDDGSLSVYCGRLGIPYVNVESQHGHLLRQIRMLYFAFRQLTGRS